MWHPSEKIRWLAQCPPWPSAEEASRSNLFAPWVKGNLQLAQRTWVPAMVPWRATEDGYVTDANLDWYERFAKGQPGAIVVEATGIRDIPSGPLLRIGDDRFLPGLKELAQTVQRASEGKSRILIQLIDFLGMRRRPSRERFLSQYLTISATHRKALCAPLDSDDQIRKRLLELDDLQLASILSPEELQDLAFGHRDRVTDVHIEHIAQLPQRLPGLFADAAERAQHAGFDGVELHYAHAYTMASFLSAHNRRTDGFGGERQNRIRVPLTVYHAVRDRVGPTFPVGCRLLAEECIDGGNTIADASYFALQLGKAGMDFISLSRGGKFEDAAQPRVGEAAYPYTGPSGYECMPSYLSDARGPFGRAVTSCTRIRQALRGQGLETPVVVSGGIYNFAQAHEILAQGAADIVGLARQALADPDWFRKVRSGHGAAVRVCRYSNYCEGLDQKHKPVTCELWDRERLDDSSVKTTVDRRRRLTAPDWNPS